MERSCSHHLTRRSDMDGVKDLAAVVGLHNHLRTARSVLVDDAHKTYGQIDDCVTTLARERATWVTRSRVELESRA
jgi:hypothetical protein